MISTHIDDEKSLCYKYTSQDEVDEVFDMLAKRAGDNHGEWCYIYATQDGCGYFGFKVDDKSKSLKSQLRSFFHARQYPKFDHAYTENLIKKIMDYCND